MNLTMIGVITLHYGHNYGAILQALSMARLFDATIVDHRYREKLTVYDPAAPEASLQSFIDHHLPLTPRFESNNHGEAATLEWMDSNCDGLVYGSDEIWRLSYTKPGMRKFMTALLREPRDMWHRCSYLQTNPWNAAMPNLYWPMSDKPSAAVSASIGGLRLKHVPGRHQRRMRESLRRLSFIGVRDRPTRDIVAKLLGSRKPDIHLTPDPVFSHQADEYAINGARQKLQTAGINPDSDFVFYAVDDKKHETTTEGIRDCGMPTIDLKSIGLDPLEWFAAIGLAKAGITDRMHALIASLIQDTPCLSVDNRRKSHELVQDFKLGEHNSLDDLLAAWPKDHVRDEVARRKQKLQDVVSHVRCEVFGKPPE